MSEAENIRAERNGGPHLQSARRAAAARRAAVQQIVALEANGKLNSLGEDMKTQSTR